MSKQFTQTKTIILGYGKYKKENTLTNFFIRYENLLTAIQCFSFAKLANSSASVDLPSCFLPVTIKTLLL